MSMNKKIEEIKDIDAYPISLNTLLENQKYDIEYYQREYEWGEEHVKTLLNDLIDEFYKNYDAGHGRDKVEGYNNYYMGPVTFIDRKGHKAIIDGQQRLTSFTLLLIYLRYLQKKITGEDEINLDTLIFNNDYGYSSNIYIADRRKCMESLLRKNDYKPPNKDTLSVHNMVDRYKNIKNYSEDNRFPTNEELPLFITWIKNNVIFIHISSERAETGYMIFETMNDRGKKITPIQMLKGYLISKTSEDKKEEYDEKWKNTIQGLLDLGENYDSNFFHAFLRAKYAETIRGRGTGEINQDFENIGGKFHQWVRKNEGKLKLKNNNDFDNFLDNTINFYSKIYINIILSMKKEGNILNLYYLRPLENSLSEGLLVPLLMAPIKENDNSDDIKTKIELVGRYIEMLCIRRKLNRKLITDGSMHFNIYTLIKNIRSNSIIDLGKKLKEELDKTKLELDSISNYSLQKRDKKFVRVFLQRITQHVDKECKENKELSDYIEPAQEHHYDIEHIWSNNFEEHKKECNNDENYFNFTRNRIGGLLLLPGSTNRSIQDKPYKVKLEKIYSKQNMLARSLSPSCYENNPTFMKYIKRSGILFKDHPEFKKDDFTEREKLYRQIAEEIWGMHHFDEFK